MQKIIRDCYEQWYGDKMDNLGEMDRFLEKFNLPRLNQVEIMNNPITSTEIEAVIKKKNSPKKIKSRTRWQPGRILSNIQRRANVYPKTLPKITEERTLPNSFYEATITVIPKPDKDNTQKRKLQGNIADEHRCRNSRQNSSKPQNGVDAPYQQIEK